MLRLAVDGALGCLVVESALLFWLAHRRGGPLLSPALPTLGAGFCLLLALRFALSDQSAFLILTVLAVAGLCHAFDLSRILGWTPLRRTG